jgi:phosphoglycolate phosphatase
MLDNLKSHGMMLGIVSTKFRYRILDILKRDNLTDYFDIIIGGEDVINHKPDPEGLLKAISGLSVSKTECLYAGDSGADGEAAIRGDVKFAAVGSGVTKLNDLKKYNPVLICKSVTQLPDLI